MLIHPSIKSSLDILAIYTKHIATSITTIIFSMILFSSCTIRSENELQQALLEHESKIPIRHICAGDRPPIVDPYFVSLTIWNQDF